MKIIDIGCGRKKIRGSIGIDFSSMTDADLFLNLNDDPLPFEENTIDFAYSSHTLEHLTKDGFFNVMREVYRVLKPGAGFQVVVPYFTTSANLANPFHNNDLCFNEHTFRFFSSEPETEALRPEDYRTPSCPQWGLRYSANFELGMEFRTRRMKLYYYPEYREAAEDARRRLRSTQHNVVDQISYSLMAVKPCPIRPETAPIASGSDPNQLVESQLEHLARQIEWIVSHAQDRPAEFAPIVALRDGVQKRGQYLYEIEGNPLPAEQLVYELDDVIQYLRRFIDKCH